MLGAIDDPRPYNSNRNGSAMRVSPVGMYAESLEEALELARISASVSHNHPDGIKGAQAVAACVFMKKSGSSDADMKEYIEQTFGYDLNIRLEDIRDEYKFDVTCEGSVPIAIMAYLQRAGVSSESILRLAVSMGGDSDTIASIACAIDYAHLSSDEREHFLPEVQTRCREILPTDLLGINDRFERLIL